MLLIEFKSETHHVCERNPARALGFLDYFFLKQSNDLAAPNSENAVILHSKIHEKRRYVILA